MRQLLRNLALVALMCVPWVTQGQSFSWDFESDNSGWQFANVASGNSWVIGEAQHNGAGTHSLYVSNDDGTTADYNGSNTVIFAWRDFTLTQAGSYDYSFDWLCKGESSWDFMRVYLIPEANFDVAQTTEQSSSYSSYRNSGSGPSNLASYAIDGGSKLNLKETWQTQSGTKVLAAGTYRFYVMWVCDASNYAPSGCIDNIAFTLPTCPKPTLATNPFSNITSTGATITWTNESTPPSGGWEIRYRVSGSSGDYTIVTAAGDATSKALTNLTASTSYEVSVRAHCDGDDYSDWTATKTLTTACENVATGTTWNFEGMTTDAVPQCWYKPTTSDNITVKNSTSYSHNSSYYLDFRGSTSNLIVLPATEAEINTLQVRFWTRPENAGNSSCGSFSVGYVTDISDASTFVAIATYNYNDFEGTSSSNTQYAEKAVVLNTAPAGARIAMRHNPSSTYYYWYVDDVTIETPPNCVKPTLASNASGVTNSSVTVSWTPDGSTTDPANGWEIRYRVSGSDGDYTTANAASNATSKTLTDLTANTSYEVSVRAHCEGSDYSDWSVAKVFKTLCNPTGLPYEINFDDLNNYAMPDCWILVAGLADGTSSSTGIYPDGSYTQYSHSATKCLRLGYGSTNNVIAVPPLNIEANTTQVEFFAKAGSSSYNALEVGYLTNASDATTFVAVRSLNASEYTNYPTSAIKVPMVSAPAGAVIAFRFQPTSTYHYWYIDDVTIDEAPNCMAVNVGDVTATSTTSASFSWTDGNSGTPTYTVKMGETELSGSTTPAVSITGTTATLTGLTAEHQYTAGDFTVIANCGGSDHSEAANVPAFYTGYCLPGPTNVDGNGITAVSFGTGEGTTVNNSGSKLPPSAPYYGNYSSMIGAVAAGTTANIDVTFGTSCTYGIVVWVDWNNNLTFEDAEVVYTGSIGGASTEVLPVSFNIDINQALGDYRLRIGGADSYFDSYVGGNTSAAHDPCYTGTWAVFHDYTLRVTEAPSCMPVTNLTAPEANITSSSIALTWTDNNNGSATYIITDGEDNAIPAAQIENLTASGVTITGLTANTAYSFKVKADCGGGEYSDAVSVNNVKTACGTETIPFTENFDSYTASAYSTAVTPDCWIFSPEPTGYYYTSIYNEYPYSGTLNLRFYSYYKANNVVVLPEMAAATNTLQVRFYHRPYSTSYGTMQVGYVTDIEDTTTFVNLKTLARTSTTYAPEEITFEAAPAGSRIAFRYIGSTYNSSYKWYIDDITVETIPNCKNVTAVTAATNITSNSATLSWTDTRNEGATYTIYNKATEPATILGTTTEAGVTTINLTGLTAHTTYNQLVIVANCSENEHSGEVSVPSFTTKRNECAITGVTVTAPAGVTRGVVVINDHSVTIPVYYLTAEEIAALTGTITKSTSATIYAYNATTSDWTTTVSSLAGIRDDLAMNTPCTLCVKAEDPTIYAYWTITLQGEDCSTPRNLTFAAERTSLTANWVNADPAAENYQVVISPSRLDAAALEAADKTAVNGAKTYTFPGLLRETKYHVYVRTNCGNDTYSSWLNDSVTTKSLTFCEDIDVADGPELTTNGRILLRSTYQDEDYRSQVIYPASKLTELEGKTISSIKFYLTGSSEGSYGDWAGVDGNTFTLKLANTTQENLSSGWDETAATTVYSGTIDEVNSSNGNTMVFVLTTPFTYTGGNLLVELLSETVGEYSSTSFRGISSTDAARYAEDDEYLTGDGTVQSFLPKFTATYCEANEACPAVAEIEVSDIAETGATVTWTASAGDYVSSYQVIKSAVELDAAAPDAYTGPYAYEGEALTCELTGLTAYTDYYVYVRAYCGAPDDMNSTWQSTTFRTLSACGAVSNLAVNQTSKTTVVATWTKTKEAQANNFNYILSTTEYNVETEGDVLNGLPKSGSGITDLTVTLTVNPATHYYLYVQNYCEGEGASPWKSVDFTTYDAMPAVVNITATQITHTAIAATWQKNVAQFANETQWQVAAVEHGDTPENDAWIAVNDTHYTFVGLTPETSYDLYVRPYQANPEAFGTVAHLDDVTTTALPPACEIVASTPQTSSSNLPIYGTWTDDDQVNQMIYPADMLEGLNGKNINSLKFFSSSDLTGWGTRNITLKLAEIEASTLTNFITPDSWATVFTGDITKLTDGFSVDFTEPYTYNGGNLLVEIDYEEGSYVSKTFYGISRDNAGIYSYGSSAGTSGTIQNFLPKAQFCYEAGTCRDITNITVSDVTTNSANVSWMPGNAEVEWIYNIRNAELGEPTGVDYFFAETPYVSYDALLSDHDYRFWVRPWVNGEPCGNWSSVAFQTVASCGMPTVLPADGITATTATLHALAHPTIGTAQSYSFRYWKSGEEENPTPVPASATNSAEITGLTPNTTYWYDVMVSCGENDDSRWSEPKSFVTDYQNFTLPYTTDFATASRDKEWRIVNGTHDNKWCIGEATGNPARSMYISNNGGVTNAYNNSGYCIVYAYAGFNNFEAAKQYTVEFDWKSNGESGNYDFIRAWIVPDNAVFEANTDDDYPAGMSAATENPTGWISLDDKTPLKYVNDWQHKKAYVTVPADGAYKIVFMWRQDNSVGTNPPAAIDNVSIVESEKYDITVNVTKTTDDVTMGAAPTAEVSSTPLASLTDIYEHTTVTLTAGAANYGYQFVNWTNSHDVTMGAGKYVTITLMSDTVLNANYDSATFTVTAVADDAERGTAYGTATVKFNLPVMLTARPNTGYHFVNWTSLVDGVPVVAVEPTVEDTIIVNAYRDSAFTAHFDTNEYHVTVYGTYDVVNNNAEMGTVTGPSTIKHFKNADYVPTANYGYHFVNWTDAFDNVLPVKEGTENTLNIAAVSDTTVYANFDYNVYSVIGESANTIMGNVTGSDEVNYHSTVTLTATPEEGYHFVNWTENNVVMGTNATINVFADSNRTLIAHFDTNVYHVTVNVNNTTMGSVSGPATVKHFKNADYEATENTGYHFVNWTNMAGTEIAAEAILNIAPVSDTTVNANFAVNTYALTVNVAAECTGMGTVSGSNAAAEHFQNYQISATPATGYHFAGWADLAPTDPNYTANPRTVTLTKDSTFTASFDTNVYVLTVVSANETMGSVDGSVAAAKHFVNYEISAEANYGYHFTGWNDNNTDNPRTVTLTENKTYTANFTYNPYTVSGVSADPTMGNVSGSATVNYLTPVTLTATPNYGYVFVKWEEADTVYSTNATIDVVANAARTLKAYFAKDMFTVTASVAAGCETMGAVAPASTTAEYMTPVTLTATPAEGYHLVSWSNGATTEQITVLADTNRALVATFAINKYDITVRYDATRGSVTDAQSHVVADSTVFTGVEHGTVLNFTATVAEGSRFAGWNDGATTVTTENIAYTATATKTLTANFIDAGKFQVTLNYNDVMGTVTGDGEHHADSTVTITATPNYGYHFVAWVQGTDSIFTPSHTFTMPQGEVEYTAVFDFNQYTLTVVSADTNMGKVTGTATVNYLTNVPVNATNKYGYHFTHWYGNGINDTVATTANATIQVLRDSTVTANFDYNQYIVTAVSADENTGSVSGTDTVNYLSNVTLTATPAAGYHFVNWTNAAGAEVCTTATYVVQATENATYTANFATTPAQLAWSAESFTGYSFIDFNNWAPTLQNPNNVEVRYGVVETGTMVNAETGVIGVPATYGNIVSITGTYHIYAVHETSQQYYYDSVVYTLTVENGTLIALSKNISDGGTVSFPDYTQESTLAYHYADENMMAFIAHGTTVRAQATPATGFNFVEWRSGYDMAGYDSLTTNNPVTYTVPDEAAAGLKAIFDTIVYNVTVVANPVEGSVEGPATVKHFLSGTYTATATPCYHFVNWTDADGAILGTTSTYTLNEPTANVELHANFALNSYAGDTTVNVCDAFTWHDSTYTVTPATNPTYVYKTVNNCDSTVTLHLTIRHSNTGDTTAVACNSFEWYGVTYNTTPAVAPTHEFTNVAGCDSIVTLHLTVNHSNTGDTTAVTCDSFDWYEHTNITASTETLTHVFTNVAGCDSTVTLHLTINHSNTGDTTAVACNSFTWYGVTYTSTPAVAPTHEFTNVAGCDSTVTLHLTINHSNTGDTTAVACNSFTWYGETYTSTPAVAPTHEFTNVAGCDSIVTLHLTVNHSNTGDTTAVACDSFDWYEHTNITASTETLTHVFTNVAGCDSTVTLHLTINHSNTGDTNAVACDSFDWYEHTNITASTETLTHVFTNVAGCDSTVTLHLTVNHSNTGDTNAVACDSLFWNGEWRVESGEYNRTLSNVAGCDSIVTLHLTINHSQTVALDPVSAYDSYEWNDETYTESGLLTFTTEGANGCDSTTTVMLTILHYDSITVILTVNDATMGTTDPVAGTYRFYPGDAVTATATANDGHHFVGWAVSNGMVGDTLSEAQLSYEFLPEMAGMTLYVEAVFAQDAVGIENVDYSNINIFSADNKVYVKGAEGMTIYIYDVNGRCMANRANAANTETFTLNMTGVVLVKAGNAPAKRVVLVR